MKALAIQGSFGLDALKPIELPEPKPGPGQVVVRMKAASLNYRDLLVVKGQYNPKFKLPLIPLSDGVGEVTELGAGVTRVKEGDRVTPIFFPGWLDGELTAERSRAALGGEVAGVLAERVVVSADSLVPALPSLTDEQAAALPCAAVTAWHALFHQERSLKAGDVLLTQGTGGVSVFALQFARAVGARVIVTSSSDEKLARAKELGASETINYRTTPAWEKRALELTDGVGVDQVIEVGGAGTLAQSLRAVRVSGRVSVIGVLAGGAAEVALFPVLMKNLSIHGVFVGSRAMFEAMNRAIAANGIKPVVDRVFPFDEIHAALRHMEAGGHFGKIAIRF